MEEISKTDGVNNEVLQRVKRGGNMLNAIKEKKANCLVASCVGNAF
jgi:hypothetical protein